MAKTEDRIKKRLIYRRGEYAPGRYVRFEVRAECKLVELSTGLNVEVAELVRIAVDDLLENKELTKALKMITKSPLPKALPKSLPARQATTQYVPLAELGVAQ